MNEVDVRKLFATEARNVGTSTIDIDQVIRRERRAMTRRRSAFGAAMLAVGVGGAMAGPAVIRHWTGPAVGLGGAVTQTPAPTPTPTPTPTHAPTPTAPRSLEEGNATVEAVLTENFPDAVLVDNGEVRRGFGEVGGLIADAEQSAGGRVVATISIVTLFWPAQAERPDNPCELKPGETPGRQGAPRVDDVCHRYPQVDGTVVWVHSTNQPDGSRVVYATQFRTNGSKVEVGVYYGRPVAEFAPFADAALVGAVTDPRLIPLPRPS